MGHVFDVDGEVVWSPAPRIGKLFVVLVDALAEGCDRDGRAAGFTMMANDYYHVGSRALAGFVHELLSSSFVRNAFCKE
jgi:hypothetical protein